MTWAKAGRNRFSMQRLHVDPGATPPDRHLIDIESLPGCPAAPGKDDRSQPIPDRNQATGVLR